MSTEILIFGTGEFPRRNFNRVADEFFGNEDFDYPVTAVFFADSDWSATTDVAFDYAMESEYFTDEPVVLAPTDDEKVDDLKLLEDLTSEGAVVERYDDVYAGVMTRSDFTHALCLFDENDEDLAEDVMVFVEDGRVVYDVVGGMLEFDVAVEEAEDVEPEHVEEPEDDEMEAVNPDDSAPPDPEEKLHPKVKVALDKLHEALSDSDSGDADTKALASQIGRGAMEKTLAYLGIEQYKGMHTKTMVDEVLDSLWETMQAAETSDEEPEEDLGSEDSADSDDSVDSADSDDSPDEDEEEPEAQDVEVATVQEDAYVGGEPTVTFSDGTNENSSGTYNGYTVDARPAMVHVAFADLVELLALYDGDVEEAVKAAAAFGVTFEDAR